ncbi:hypothetical protein GN316_09045 [Xylophilus sp. Kf1]|nr:hypothetical protein [Xylophilus sp. Kf1]
MFPNATGLTSGLTGLSGVPTVPTLLPLSDPPPPHGPAPWRPGTGGDTPLDRALRDLPHVGNPALDDPSRFQPPTTPPAGARPAPRTSDPFRIVVHGRTVGDWIVRYGEAIWNQRTPELPPINMAPESIRHEVMTRLGGRLTPQGKQVSRQFSELRAYLHELAGVRDRYLAQHPRHADLLRETADGFMRSACSRLSYGLHDSSPEPRFAFRVDPVIAHAAAVDRAAAESAAAQEAADRAAREAAQKTQADAERKVLREVDAIMAFWQQNLDGTEEWMAYMLGGQMVFETVEDMEKNCPPGAYRQIHDPFLSQALHGRMFEYGGSGVKEVYLRLPSGRMRQVAFRGPTWAYLSEDPQYRDEPLPENHPALHVNPWWNPEPRIVQARVEGSKLSRNR